MMRRGLARKGRTACPGAPRRPQRPPPAAHGRAAALRALQGRLGNRSLQRLLAEHARGEEPLGAGGGERDEGGERVRQDTGGYSVCNLAGERPRIVNENNECTRPCTQRHEEQHRRDDGACCERARAAYQANGADQAEIMRRWNAWVDASTPYQECRAYGVSVSCAEGMARDRSCSSPSRDDRACCAQVSSYLTHVRERRTHYCGLPASSAAPACPF
jgi:hypothetical protein